MKAKNMLRNNVYWKANFVDFSLEDRRPYTEGSHRYARSRYRRQAGYFVPFEHFQRNRSRSRSPQPRPHTTQHTR